MNAMELIGCSYVLGGNTPEEGFDCYGLLKYVRSRYFNLETPLGGGTVSTRERFSTHTRECAIELAATQGGWKRVDLPGLPGDCVLLGRRRDAPTTHLGIALPSGVLHAFRGESGEGGSVILTPWQYLELAFHRIEVWQCSQRCS